MLRCGSQISGFIGTALHYATYNLMLAALPESFEVRTTAAWICSYLLSIGTRKVNRMRTKLPL